MMCATRWLFGLAILCLTLVPSIPVSVTRADDAISFSRHIQPIFSEHCLQCHGPDAEKREADLRLDVEQSAKELAIVAGAPDDSELIARITSNDSDVRMPPSEAKPLSTKQIDLLRQWITDGAKYEQHWAFRPIESVKVPEVEEKRLTDVDKFVIAKLKEKNLDLSKPATKQQLIRRATFDLTGLPPTWAEVTDFLNDSSPHAFEKIVDRLLDSSAYGQRWGRHWLDIARYADTHGGAAIGFKKFAFSYTYRDYVIAAFNKDLPYNQFVIEQLAADQLGLAENAEQLAALGFLTVGMQFRNPHNKIDDQIDVVTRGLMGLTVSCARCHDHKFDAIMTKDYYSLYAAFASSQKPEELPLIGTPEPSDALRKYEEDLQSLEISYSNMAREQSEIMRGRLRMQVGLYLREIAKDVPEPDLVSADIFSYRTDDLRPNVLHSWQKYVNGMPEDDAVFGPWVQLSHSRLGESNVKSATPPISTLANFATHCEQLLATLKKENGEPKELHKLSAEAPRWNPRVLEALTANEPKSMLDVADAYGELFGEVHREWLQALLETSLEARPGNTPVPDENEKHLVANSPVNRQLRRHLYGPGSPTNMDDRLASRLLNRPINDNVNGRREAIHKLNLSSPGSPSRAMVLSEQADAEPFYVFVRGNPLQRGDFVSARFLSALGGNDQKSFLPGKRRLDLARSIVDPANPLTRRVIVNCVWQHHFGKALVRTPDDFGTRGDPPTHPKLLDYLATKLLEDGWSLKQLHRRIMLSKVYQQASVERTAARIADPNNALLWRMPRQRLELEAMRDAMLFASEELKDQMGGRPFELLSKPIIPRRSVYALVNRDIVAPLMSTFDVANPNACTAKRPETTVPQQTLFALNSDFIQDRAEVLAKLVVETASNGEEKSDSDVVRALYRRAFSRDPDKDELKTALAYVKPQQAENDSMKRWHRLAHVLLAANEFVFVD
jgi:hypothetical protein